MKFGLLVCSPSARFKNLGDYIQSVAQEQFLPKVDTLVEREYLSSFSSGNENRSKTKVVMNGWFMWHPSAFPPSQDIVPLFISFHITPLIESSFFTRKTIDYLKKYQPIGARDLNTMRLLKKYGIECYFSNCLTLTLGNSFIRSKATTKYLFVDPYYVAAGSKQSLYNPIEYVKGIWYLIKHFRKARQIKKSFCVESKTVFRLVSSSFEKLWCAAFFYEYYSTAFSDEILLNAEFHSHKIPSSMYGDTRDWMNAARIAIQRYADARFVVTSRIHCGLPCLSVETPCLFIVSDGLESGVLREGGRFEGVLNLFHVARWTRKGIIGVSPAVTDVLSEGRLMSDSSIDQLGPRLEYRAFRDKLNDAVHGFLRE